MKIGDIYAWRSDAGNPWNTIFKRVEEIRGKWVRCIFCDSKGFPKYENLDNTIIRTKLDLWLFHKRMGWRNPNPPNEPPW